jgi:hypothetical protein
VGGGGGEESVRIFMQEFIEYFKALVWTDWEKPRET